VSPQLCAPQVGVRAEAGIRCLYGKWYPNGAVPAVPSWCKPAMTHRCRFPCAADHAFSRSPKLFSVSHTEKNTKRMRIFFFPFGNLSTPMFKAAAISDTCTAKHGALSGSHLLVVLPTNLVLTPYVLWDRHPRPGTQAAVCQHRRCSAVASAKGNPPP